MKKQLNLKSKHLLRVAGASVLMLLLCCGSGFASILPSQVLVLYNADWTDDAPLTEPGQDSLEIAEHYVRMHTDPASGDKPYLLGLHCEHGIKVLDEARHLNAEHLIESSDDNQAGVVAKRSYLFDPSARDDQLRDSRLVEFVLPGGRSPWQMNTLQMTLEPDKGTALTLVKDGLIEAKGQIAGNSGDDWTIRLNAKSFVSGDVTIQASCTDVKGEVHSWQADYVDVDNVERSDTGRDGNRDDQHFLDDVAAPVTAFLEDPRNAREDGTLLKDHILFMVVCYGLPRTAVAPAGIARGITNQINNFGSIIDFGQRLQLLYYDLDRVAGQKIKGYKFVGKGPFSDYFLRSAQAWPLYENANPFAHPQLYSANPSFENGPQPPAYTAVQRSQHPERFLYFVSRIDAPDPLQAKALIDRSVYASLYAGPDMGVLPGKTYEKNKQRVGYLDRSIAGASLWQQGYRHLYYGGQSKNLLEWGRLTAEDGFINKNIAYLPGGIAATVISHNGWNKGEMVTDLTRGVTATAGAAKVYRGAPHIHNKSWWDDDVFYPALAQGKTLGEAWLMNQVHLGWITTFVGDPLMTWAGEQARSAQAIHVDPEDIRFNVVKDANGTDSVWMQIYLSNTVSEPQVAQVSAVSATGTTVTSDTFDNYLRINLGSQSVCEQVWTVTLITPYGKKFSQTIAVDCAEAQKTPSD